MTDKLMSRDAVWLCRVPSHEYSAPGFFATYSEEDLQAALDYLEEENDNRKSTRRRLIREELFRRVRPIMANSPFEHSIYAGSKWAVEWEAVRLALREAMGYEC